MPDANKSKRKRVLPILLGVLLLPVGVLVWQVYKPKNDPRFIGVPPADMHLIPRSHFGTKPWIDLPWFGGRLQYPPIGTMPKGWVDEPLASGIFTWDAKPIPGMPATSGTPATPMPTTALMSAMMFAYSEWEDPSGRKHSMSLDMLATFSATREYAACPYVFGDKPIRFKVSSPDALFGLSRLGAGMPQQSKFQIEIPPLNIPAPTLEPRSESIGEVKLRFRGLKWVGPSFGATIEVTASNLPDGHTLLIYNMTAQSGMIAASPICLLLESGSASEFAAGTGSVPMDVILARAEKSKVRVVKLPPPKTSSSTPFATGIQEYAIKDQQGKELMRGTAYGPQMSWYSANMIPMKINGEWIGLPYSKSSNLGSLISMSAVVKTLAPGDYDAVVYRTVEKKRITLTDIVPKVDHLVGDRR